MLLKSQRCYKNNMSSPRTRTPPADQTRTPDHGRALPARTRDGRGDHGGGPGAPGNSTIRTQLARAGGQRACETRRSRDFAISTCRPSRGTRRGDRRSGTSSTPSLMDRPPRPSPRCSEARRHASQTRSSRASPSSSRTRGVNHDDADRRPDASARRVILLAGLAVTRLLAPVNRRPSGTSCWRPRFSRLRLSFPRASGCPSGRCRRLLPRTSIDVAVAGTAPPQRSSPLRQRG